MFPFHCVLCGARCLQRDLCPGCCGDLPWLGHGCARCGLPLAAGDAVCGRCLRRPPPLRRTVAAFHYAFPVDRLLLRLKFGGALVPGRVLGELLADVVAAAGIPDLIAPVPLHPRRQRERGYNQALEIARPVGRALRVPVVARACRRVADTPAQSTLTAAERRRNLRRAFVADPRAVSGRRIAVVDDVVTTGSTLAAIARALHAAGARSVDAWCVARA